MATINATITTDGSTPPYWFKAVWANLGAGDVGNALNFSEYEWRTYQIIPSNVGQGGEDTKLQVSNDGVNWKEVFTNVLSGNPATIQPTLEIGYPFLGIYELKSRAQFVRPIAGSIVPVTVIVYAVRHIGNG